MLPKDPCQSKVIATEKVIVKAVQHEEFSEEIAVLQASEGRSRRFPRTSNMQVEPVSQRGYFESWRSP